MSEKTKKIIYFTSLFFIELFIVSEFFVRAKYDIYLHSPVLLKQKLYIFIPLVLGLLLVNVGLYRICLKLNRFPKKIVVPGTLFMSFLIQVAIIFAFSKLPEADSQSVLSIALSILRNNDYSSFESGGYLYMFPYNSAMVLYLKTLLTVLPANYLVLKTANILFTLVTSLMIYLIYGEMKNESKGSEYGVLVFASLYIPALFMCNLIYNDIVATAFFISAVYCLIRYVKNKKKRHIIGCAVLLAAGNYFRGVGAVVLIAAVIYLLLHIKKTGVNRDVRFSLFACRAVFYPVCRAKRASSGDRAR